MQLLHTMDEGTWSVESGGQIKAIYSCFKKAVKVSQALTTKVEILPTKHKYIINWIFILML